MYGELLYQRHRSGHCENNSYGIMGTSCEKKCDYGVGVKKENIANLFHLFVEWRH